VASLLATSRNLNQSLLSLRPKCEFFSDLTVIIDSMVGILEADAERLSPCLTDAGDDPGVLPDQSVDEVVTDVFARLPVAAQGIFAAEVAVNLRLLARHLELKTRLAAESALLVGQDILCRILMLSAAEWGRCDRMLRTVTVRARALAYVADLDQAGAVIA
jgi:hypothetical protein